MNLFDNRDYPNYEQVAEMGPSWLMDFKEMDANYQFAGWTLDLAAYFLDKLIDNEFPEHCDEETLRKFERILVIEYPSDDITLEERRRIVSAFWAGNGKLSKTSIVGIVSAYTGQDADVRWEDGVLVIDFDNSDTAVVSMSMLQSILRRRMPAHIGYIIRCMCTATVGVSVSRGFHPVSFGLTGTLPKLSRGAQISRDGVDAEVTGHGNMVPHHLCGGYSLIV